MVGLRFFSERVGDAVGVPVLDTANEEELIHVQPGVSIVLANRPPEAPGTLYITSRKVIWLSDLESAKGYAVDFLSVSLHAVSTDPEAFTSPCIYAQIDTGDISENDSEGSDLELDGTLDLSNITEMRLIPSDPTQLDHLFEIFCKCAELNPETIEEDEEEEHNWIFSADQLDDAVPEDADWSFFQDPTSCIGQSNGDHDLAHSVLELQINDERFNDAESDEEENHGHAHL